jgi:type VI secretion system protein ImpL
MMQRLWQLLMTRSSLITIGCVAFAAFLMIASLVFEIALQWTFLVLGSALLAGAVLWHVGRLRRKRVSKQFGDMLERQAVIKPDRTHRDEVTTIRERMQEAIGTIKTSKMGQLSGDAALYELPWYMIIGNPAAGKSTAIANSGLQFPFADGKIVQGTGGTRNCDWFFTTDGIVLDTAGRYAVIDDDRAEWFDFLGLLKKYRKRAPINGIILAVSIAELTGNRPEFAINLASNLRQRVQELTERLEVHAPVYVMFTKADLISGFSEFFSDAERTERDKVWGATLPYNLTSSSQDVLEFFDQRFNELYDGLKELSLASMALNSGERLVFGALTFPLEFFSIKDTLRAFIATLFEENPFQFKPVLRGFYFTSALQEGAPISASSKRVAQRFGLKLTPQAQVTVTDQYGYFLLNLFRKVIFADKDLVAQYASPNKTRLRYVSFFTATALVGLALGGWSWSYINNRQLVANVQADLDQAVRLQDKRLDLQSRFAALEIMQDRIEQLEQYRSSRPWALGLGLYQGDLLDRKLRAEYFSGIREVMLKPVAQSLEAFLSEVNVGAENLTPIATPQSGLAGTNPGTTNPGLTNPGLITQGSTNPTLNASNNISINTSIKAASAGGAGQQFKEATPANVEDAYNALKTYLMLGDRSRAEAGHLNDQLTRFWRVWLDGNRGTMPREQMIRSAERMISFYLSQVNDPSWPHIDIKLALVDRSRDSLRRVVRGMPALERVYADIKARAATRFPSMTVARIVGEQDKDMMLGSHAITGTFTRDAWEKFIQDAFKEAANRELQSADWVLKTASSDDLTLEGSPEQIQKVLVDLYKNDYAKEWKKFVQGVNIRELGGFDNAAVAMNRLGDPQTSPINTLVTTVYQETSWDNPSLLKTDLQQAQRGIMNWIKETILRQKPPQPNLNLTIGSVGGVSANMALGPVGREFSGVARLVVSKDQSAPLMRDYMAQLSKLRSRFNTIKNQGDTGPGAKQFMQQTLDGSGSELADALKYVDEQMLAGMTEAQKQVIRPILVRPLMQTFAVIIEPTEAEINKIWAAQVLDPFQKNLALKYPFAPESKVEASNADIGQVFGPEGTIAKFFTSAIGPLVVRHGDTLSAKTWANMGISLAPPVMVSFPTWIAPIDAGGMATAAGASEAQTRFDLQALQAPGAAEYTIEIDGQRVDWRGQPQPWVHMVWPNPQGVPGARISVITPDGRTLLLLNEPGHFGLKKTIEAAQSKRKEGGVFELSWENDGVTVNANLKIISAPTERAQQEQDFRRMKLPTGIVGGVLPATPQTIPQTTPLATTAAAPP